MMEPLIEPPVVRHPEPTCQRAAVGNANMREQLELAARKEIHRQEPTCIYIR
ncbi:MAG: hypothetical protein GY819_08295 [Planctomycetaceae bacterium]|nr:hypothetical protein [Planctomycetaceae bacterium]